MKIQCQSCQAKYTIADEKVLGKVVKIRCKKCSSTIVINGNETRPAEDNAETHVFDYAGQANEPWTVNVADGDQRTMTGQEIVSEYKAGVVNDETYCWKDGMADWLPLREIEPLYNAVRLGPGRLPQESQHDDISVPPQSIPPPASNAAALFAANEASAVDSPFAGNADLHAGRNGTNGNGLYGAPTPEPAGDARPAPAARRGGGRGQGADLFGNAASAGGEDDVMTSAAAGSTSGGGGGGGGGLEEHKLTGQRNESSVLFSLSALTEGNKPEPTNRTTATADGSGLIDIRALSQTMGADDKKDTNARVDDIMNLSGGGAFGAALAAPILAPPPLEMATSYGETSGGRQKSNSTLIIAILGGAALIAIGIVVAVMLTRPTVPPIDASNSNPSGSAAGMATPSATVASGITAPTASATDTTAAPAGSAPGATADNTPAPPGTGNATGKAAAVTGAAPTHNPPGHVVADNTPPPPATTHAAAPAAPPQDFAGALAQAANKPAATSAPAAPAAGGAPFDRGAASGAIGAVNVQSCAKPGGPTGSGHVKITFAPDGSVSAAVLDSGPFTGTPVGGCVAGKFRSPHVPPFSGGAITVGKSFSIN